MTLVENVRRVFGGRSSAPSSPVPSSEQQTMIQVVQQTLVEVQQTLVEVQVESQRLLGRLAQPSFKSSEIEYVDNPPVGDEDCAICLAALEEAVVRSPSHPLALHLPPPRDRIRWAGAHPCHPLVLQSLTAMTSHFAPPHRTAPPHPTSPHPTPP